MSKNTNGNRKRKTYNADFKAKLVLELLKEEKSLNEIASSHEVLPKSLLEWKKQFLENISLAFDKSTVVKEYKDAIEILQKSNDELAKKVGNLTTLWLCCRITRDLHIRKIEICQIAIATTTASI